MRSETGTRRRRLMARRITRRSFLVAAGTAATTATGGFVLGRITATSGGPGTPGEQDPAERRTDSPEVAAVRRLFLDSDGPRRLGEVYLAADPFTPARTAGYLPEGFVPSEAPSRNAWLGSAARQELAIRTMFLSRRDFDDGQVVDVGGWRIARSTAELCAVLARGS